MTNDEARKWAEIYTAIADGKTWQYLRGDEWIDGHGDDIPAFWSLNHVRIKTETQTIYIATWFVDNDIQACIYSSPESLESRISDCPGFLITPITREMP